MPMRRRCGVVLIVALARDLRRSVIVEGVESEGDAERMAELGCEFAQGFPVPEPLTAKDTLAYVARHYRVEPGGAGSGAAGLGG